MLLTGSKGAGKSTLFAALLDGASVPGLRSEAERGTDGLPVRIILWECGTEKRCVIGRRGSGAMQADKHSFDCEGAEMLRNVRLSPGTWAAVDEIGYLEECSAVYLEELRRLFDEKRVLAAIRKADTPFLQELRSREDCFVLDLDEVGEDL